MIKRRIIATKISITKQGEIKFFQVKIPFDAKVLIGIETAMRLRTFVTPPLPVPTITGAQINPGENIPGFNSGANNLFQAANLVPGFAPPPPIPVTRNNSLVGELKLQSSDDSNVFYATNVYDPTVKEDFDKVSSVDIITKNAWTHG